MYRISRIRLAGVGPPDARYDRPSPDAPPFEINCLGLDGLPDDTVVWLENGGGKTVFLALLFHVLRPDKAAYIGNDERGRRGNIDDFLMPGDTAHVVVEWVADGHDGRLITGLVAERRGASHSRTWYLLSLQDDVIGLDQLIFDEDGRRVSATRYIESLQTLADGAGKVGRRNRAEFAKTSTQKVWLDTLANHQLDPALFEYQVQMNRSEGGATSLFRFTSTEKFIEFFLELTMNPDTVTALSQTLARVADKVAALPRREVELAHANGSIERLERLAAAWDGFMRADEARRRAQRSAEQLHDRLAAAVDVARRRVADAKAAVEEVREQQRAADAARRDTEARARGLAIRATKAELAEQEVRIHSQAVQLADLALTARAWPHTKLAIDRRRIAAEVRELNGALRAADADAEPLRDRRDRLLRTLRAELDQRRNAAIAERVQAAQDIEEAESAREAAEQQRSEAEGDVREIDGASHELRRQVEAHERSLAAAVDAEILPAGADPASVLVDTTDELARIDVEVTELADECTERRSEISGLRMAAETSADERRAARSVAERERDIVDKAVRQRADLAAHPLLADLGAEDADLELIGAELTIRVEAEAERLRRAAIAAAAAAAEDRRAADALERDRLLPARADVDELCRQLRSGGVRSAFPGWRYIAAALPPADQVMAIDDHPAVADGIVVAAEDLERSRELLAGAAPAAAVAVAPTTVFDHQGSDTGVWVVPPAPAMYDMSHAEAELTHRTGRLDAAEAAQADVATTERTARTLASALAAHLDAWPSGALPNAVACCDELDATADRAREKADAAAQALTDAHLWIEELDQRIGELRDAERSADRRRHRLEQLVETAAAADRAVGELASLGNRRRDAQAAVEAAEKTRADAKAAAQAARAAHGTAERAAEATERALGSLPEVDDGSHAPSTNLEDLQGAYREAARLVAEVTTDSELARRLDERETFRQSLDDEWRSLGDELQRRVTELLARPAANDPTSRRAAEAEADAAASAAESRVAALRAERKQTEQRLQRLPQPERAVDLGSLPTAAAELVALSHQAEAGAEAARAARSTAEEELRRVVALQGTVVSRLQHLESFVSALSTAVGSRDPEPALPYDSDPADDVHNALADVSATTTEREEANDAWTRASAQVGSFARQDRWAELVGDLPRRLRNDAPDVLARAAADLLAQTRLLAGRLHDDIEALDTHRQLLVTSLGDTVSEARRSLQRARTKSTLPDGLGAWSGQPFLKIRLSVPADRVELDSRLRRFTNDLLEQASVAGTGMPSGAPLIRAAMLACAERSVTVEVLKPNKAQQLRYEHITEMATLSGGMRATAAIALFCTLARVRATNQTGRTGVGTLVLDNPIGDANAPYLVTLQRLMARMSDIQLLYTTGVNDMDALRQFPVLARLTNEAAKRSQLAYVVADETFLKRLAPADGDHAVVTGTRLVRRQAPLLHVDSASLDER